jgi:hypothetical protein
VIVRPNRARMWTWSSTPPTKSGGHSNCLETPPRQAWICCRICWSRKVGSTARRLWSKAQGWAEGTTLGSGDGGALIVDPKLFTGGEGSLRNLSPQPTVNNFAARTMPIVNKVNFGARAPRSRRTGKTNGLALHLATAKPRLSLPARRLGPKRILKMTTRHVSAIRTSPSPGQRARLTNTSPLL